MTAQTVSVDRRWTGTVIVVAPGESLTTDVAGRCVGVPVVAVQDAWRRVPWADVIYACDLRWWRVHDGCRAFQGERWSTHDTGNNDKREAAKAYGVRLVEGKVGDAFSTDPAVIAYGNNSGFQAVNLAILMGAARVTLVGFDMQGSHFFGSHPKPLRDPSSFATFIRAFNRASQSMPPGVEIVNATPGSALKCFPFVTLDEALAVRMAA